MRRFSGVRGSTQSHESKRRPLLVSYMTLARLYLHFVKLSGATLSSHESSGHHQSMETPPIHVLLALDAQILGGEVGYGTSTPSSPVVSLTGHDGDSTTRTTSSRFWGVSWHQQNNKWQAQYQDADGKTRSLGTFDDEEEAARAYNKAIRDAGLEGRRKTNAVDATGTLVPKSGDHRARDRSAVVAPDAARAPTEATSKFWGVCWNKNQRRWLAYYTDANGKRRTIGYFDDQEAAARAYNAAIRRAGLQGKRRTNAVVDGQLVPKSGPRSGPMRKRRRDEPAATPSTRARRR